MCPNIKGQSNTRVKTVPFMSREPLRFFDTFVSLISVVVDILVIQSESIPGATHLPHKRTSGQIRMGDKFVDAEGGGLI